MDEADRIVVRGHVRIPKHVLKNIDDEILRANLTIKSKYGDDVLAYHDKGDHYLVPRYWFARNMARRYQHLILNKDPKGLWYKKTWKFRGTLRDHQAHPRPGSGCVAVTELPQLILKHKGIFAEGPCGSGKTVSAIHTMAALGMRTIVVTPNATVRNQWIESLAQFMPDARVTVYGGSKAKKRRDLTGDVVVASLQLLAREPLPDHIEFPFYVMYECHMSAAPIYQKAMFHVAYRYSLALSATGNRFDGLDKLFRYNLAAKSVTLDTDQLRVTCLLKPFGYDSTDTEEYEQIPSMMLDRALAVNERRNITIVRAINASYQKGRKILVLGKDLFQLRILRDVFVHLAPDAKTAVLCGEITKYDTIVKELARTPAQRKEDERLINDPEAVLFSTYKMLGTGADMPEKDALICALSLLDCRQALGRIQRNVPGKPLPIALFFADDLKQMRQRFTGMYYGALKPLGRDKCWVINECPYLQGLKGSNIRHEVKAGSA